MTITSVWLPAQLPNQAGVSCFQEVPVTVGGMAALLSLAAGSPPSGMGAYPVTSVYMTISNRNAAQLLGFGTWARVDQEAIPGVYFWRRTA